MTLLKKTIPVLLGLFLFSFTLPAQNKVGVKTNLVSDALLSPNLGVDFVIAKHWSLDLQASFSAWDSWGGASLRHVLFQPEVRYWLCDHLARHFFALHLLGGKCDVGGFDYLDFTMPKDVNLSNFATRRYDGWGLGAGLSWGYDFVLGTHWNLEVEVGAGYVYLNYDITEISSGDSMGTDVRKNYFGPTKAALNLIYVF